MIYLGAVGWLGSVKGVWWNWFGERRACDIRLGYLTIYVGGCVYGDCEVCWRKWPRLDGE